MFIPKLKIVVVMLLVIGVAVGGALTQDRTAGDKKAAEPATVKVVEPKKGGLPLMVTRRAEVVAAQQQLVAPLVAGTIKEVLVDIGDVVKKGQELLVLDAPLLAKEWERATSAFETAQAKEEEAQDRVIIAEAEVEMAEAIYQVRDSEKTAALVRQREWQDALKNRQKRAQSGIGGPELVEEAKQKIAAAEGQIKAAEAALAAAQADIKIKKGKVAKAKTALKTAGAATRVAHAVMDKARIQESLTHLTAAFDGVVTRRTADPGNFVQPNDVRLLVPLLTVQRIDQVRLVVQVDQDSVPFIKRGVTVQVEMPGASGREYKISRFSPALQSGDREMTVEIDVPNGDHRLLPGMAVNIKMPLYKTSPDSLIVPSVCIYSASVRSKSSYAAWVNIVRDGKTYEKKVTVRFDDGTNAEITGDIRASDLVITKPPPFRDGTPVKVERAP